MTAVPPPVPPEIDVPPCLRCGVVTPVDADGICAQCIVDDGSDQW